MSSSRPLVQPHELMADAELNARLAKMLDLVDAEGRPNINAIWAIAKDIEAIKLNIKHFGYDLAHRLAAARPPKDVRTPRIAGLSSKPCTQADLESDWAAYWLNAIRAGFLYHRKMWELCYVPQALWENGAFKQGNRGLGFGCGEEPLPSLMTALGIRVTITDLDPARARAKGWTTTNQHTATIEKCHRPDIVDEKLFLELAELQFVDMNDIPPHLTGYDFCWSICALEHLGSIAAGLQFIENSLATLKPGGIAVHTTEFNFANDRQTVDNWPTVLFQRRHFIELYERLTAQGHRVAPLDFEIGSQPMDRFIDMPPHAYEQGGLAGAAWNTGSHHLKVIIDGFASTCFGLIIVKAK